MSIDVPTVIDHCDKQPWCGYLEEHLVLEEHQGETIESGTLGALRTALGVLKGYSSGTPREAPLQAHSLSHYPMRCIARAVF